MSAQIAGICPLARTGTAGTMSPVGGGFIPLSLFTDFFFWNCGYQREMFPVMSSASL